jgi:hypothetical protein
METPQPQTRETPSKVPAEETPAMRELDLRLKRIEAVLARMGSAGAAPAPVADQKTPPTPYVTHEELKKLLGGTEKRMENHVAEQFGNQMLAIDSLRAMIVDTDMLLERVLSRLDVSSREGSSRDDASIDDDDAPLTGKKPVSTSAG